MRVALIALHDLRRILHDRKALLFLLVMPIGFTIFMGIALKNVGNERPPTIGVVGMARPGAAVVVAGLRAAGVVVEDLADEAEGIARLHRLGAHDLDGVFLPPSTMIREADDERAPAARQALATALQRAALVDAASQALGDAGVGAVVQERLAVAAEVVLVPAGARAPRGFEQASPGILVQFAIFSLVTSALLVIQDRRTGVLARLRTFPLRASELVAGHVLAMFLLVFVQEVTLAVFGTVAFDLGYDASPLGTGLVLAALALFAAALGLLVSVVAPSEEVGIVLSLILMFMLAGLGGAWMPVDAMGKTMAEVARFVPTAHAMEGLQDIALRGRGVEAALLPAAVLGGAAVVVFGVAVVVFTRRELR